MTNKIFSFALAIFFGVVSVSQSNAQKNQNVIDFDLTEIITCVPNDAVPLVICNNLLEELLDDLVQAEQFLDQVFVGYRRDIPLFYRNLLPDTIILRVRLVENDGVFGVLACAGPDITEDFNPPPFLQALRRFRSWSMTCFGTINLDVDDVVPLLLADEMVDVMVHEAFHALGHPNNFECSMLSRNILGLVDAAGKPIAPINFYGDETGVGTVGFGLVEFRAETGNPFRDFVPLSTNDGGGHLNAFEPAFNRVDERLQDVFLPSTPPAGFRSFMSRALRGMFADLGFEIRGVNGTGFIDIDGDGFEDDPLIINPRPFDNP